MRSIAVIGAGQSGLCLATTLNNIGYKVTLFSNRTSDQIRKGRILSSQAIFHRGLQFERKWGLNYWEKQCPNKDSVTFNLLAPGETKTWLHWVGKTDHIYQSVDQRIKFSHFMEEYENAGGKLVIKDVGIGDLNQIAEENELTIVAGGKGEISQCFPQDKGRSVFDKPMRGLSCFYVHGMRSQHSGVNINLVPGIGEFFTLPALTHSGPCDAMMFEGIPGGPFDCFTGISDPKEQLDVGLKLLKKFLPLQAERCEKVELTDSQATLVGRFPPTVREPVAKLSCGKAVLGMADTVVLNDPIVGQGANNATKCAEIYLKSIFERGDEPFDEKWMRETFEMFWETSGESSTMLATMFLQPPPDYMIGYLAAATKNPLVANKLSNGFEDPSTLFPWILSSNETKVMIKEFDMNTEFQKEEGMRLMSQLCKYVL